MRPCSHTHRGPTNGRGCDPTSRATDALRGRDRVRTGKGFPPGCGRPPPPCPDGIAADRRCSLHPPGTAGCGRLGVVDGSPARRYLPGWLGAVWLWPTLATLAVTGAGIGSAQPWRDELATWSAATRPLGDLARMAGTIDAATWPYYLFMHGWVALCGDSPAALRTPSALATAGTAGLAAALGARLFGRQAGLTGGLLFASLPGTSRYAQEARPYAFVALFAVLATLLLVRALDRPGWQRWAGYAAVVAALGLAHLVALTLLAAHAAAVLATQRTG
ncbi:hypothetical protein E1258_23870, partial [Micromonospora sp. KC207]